MVEPELTSRFLTVPLGAAVAGDRLWFLLTEADGRPPLLLCPLDTDTAMPNLMAMLTAADLPPSVSFIQGRAELAADGALELTSHDLQPEQLEYLTSWVEAHASEQPDLARLVGTRLIRRTRGHRASVEAIIDEPALWGQLKRPASPGTMEITLARLAALRSEQRAWFFLVENGPGGRPYLHLSLESEDPECQEFRSAVTAIRQRSAGGGLTASGVLVRTRFLFTPTSTEPIPHWGPLLQSLLNAWGQAFPALLGLAAAPLTYVRGGRIAGFETSRCTLPEQSASLMRELSVLQHTRDAQQAWFWLTAADDCGRPRLCMADDRAALKKTVRDIGGDGPVIRGTVQITRGEAIELRTRSKCGEGHAALSRWIKQHQVGWPIVRLLRRAVFVEQAEDGQTIARHTAR